MKTDNPSHERQRGRESHWGRWSTIILTVVVTYVLSCGPVMAVGCWLRDVTDWDGFYAVFFLYLPILYPLGDVDFVEAYIMWWMKLFGTMPPG
jgi:hypothetical protein